MDKNLEKKQSLMMKIERYERALIELSSWKEGDELSASTKILTGEIKNESEKEKLIRVFKDICSISESEKKNNNDKLYLSELIERDNVEFLNNNLILAPTGAGKTHFMRSRIKYEDVLFLVSTTSLKDKFVPEDESEREDLGNRMFSTKRKSIYGDDSYNILVMTYAEFGEKIKFKNSFANQYKQIFCDEIHSLFHYYAMTESSTLLLAIRYLFENRETQERYYFTATNEYLEEFKRNSGSFFEDVKIYDYLDHPEIVKHMVLSSYKINNIEQIRPHLNAKLERFNYFNYKIFAFCKTIRSQLYLEEVIKSEGFKPLTLWSINNKDYPMSEEQLKQRSYVLRTGLIPEGYNALIINASMQEGWDLLDPLVKLVIMNTTNKTELVQSIGRVRQDADVLVYKSNDETIDYYINLPEKYINAMLTKDMKNELVDTLGLKNINGRKLMWPSIKKILEKQGLVVTDTTTFIDEKATRVSTISYDK